MPRLLPGRMPRMMMLLLMGGCLGFPRFRLDVEIFPLRNERFLGHAKFSFLGMVITSMLCPRPAFGHFPQKNGLDPPNGPAGAVVLDSRLVIGNAPVR